MSRARGSEEVVEVKEEKTTTIVTHNARPSRALWTDWDSPNLAEELVDRIWDMVRDWLRDREPAASDFFHYCLNLCDSRGEADEVRVWMLNLIAHFVAEDEKWLDSVHTAKDWRELALVNEDDWEVPPPLWLVRREEQMKREEEEEFKNEKAKESLECATNSPILDCGWGIGLPAPTPTATAPSTPMWRPWEEEEEEEIVNLSASKQRRREEESGRSRPQSSTASAMEGEEGQGPPRV